MRSLVDLSGKSIIVTGASSGIGRAVAIGCGELGATVALIGRRREKLEETACMIPEGKSLIVQRDLAEEDDFGGLFESVVSSMGKLGGMVYCAGIPYVMPLKALSRERLEKVMAINFYPYVEMSREFVKRQHSNDGASVVGVSAVLVDSPRPYELGYISSKAAMEAATRVMAQECSNRKIRFNCMAPGSVRTEMVQRVLAEQHNQAQMDAAANRSLFGWQEPEDVAEVCLFLLSDASRQITGKTVKADGGYV